jgi:hypothetical protein
MEVVLELSNPSKTKAVAWAARLLEGAEVVVSSR